MRSMKVDAGLNLRKLFPMWISSKKEEEKTRSEEELTHI